VTTEPVDSEQPPKPRPPTAQISNAIVRIHAELYGRGPVRVRTLWRDDLVLTVMEELFTQAERTLIDAGRWEQVRTNREVFHDQIEPLLCQAVQSATQREVKAFMAQVTKDDMGSHVFVLS
jgi:uncharacterized protein YbcI